MPGELQNRQLPARHRLRGFELRVCGVLAQVNPGHDVDKVALVVEPSDDEYDDFARDAPSVVRKRRLRERVVAVARDVRVKCGRVAELGDLHLFRELTAREHVFVAPLFVRKLPLLGVRGVVRALS